MIYNIIRIKGIPKNDVTEPMGSTTGYKSILESISAIIKRDEPIITESKTEYFSFSVQISFERCGATRPTNPIMPIIETVKLVSMEQKTNTIILVIPTSIPKDFAFFSPCIMELRSFERIRVAMRESKNKTDKTTISLMVALLTLPLLQERICVETSWLEKYRSKFIEEEKKNVFVIPINIKVFFENSVNPAITNTMHIEIIEKMKAKRLGEAFKPK